MSIPGPITPPPGETPFVPPRMVGESAYEYRKRRTITLYGQTPYQRRIYLGRLRGLSTQTARGYAPRGGETESQRRNRLSREQFGLSVSQRRRIEIRTWLEQNSFTPDTTGMTWTDLMRLGARLRYMYQTTPWEARVEPEMILEAVIMEQQNELPPGWAFGRIWDKYDAMVSYREFSDKQPGHDAWVGEYLVVHPYMDTLLPQLWYYH